MERIIIELLDMVGVLRGLGTLLAEYFGVKLKYGKNLRRVIVLLSALCVPLGAVELASANITIVTVPVANLGNATDALGLGSVAYAYNIGQTDVTVSQYTAFLNAVASTDSYGLYNSGMATASFASCGISQSGSPGSYTYATTKNGSFPVNCVSWGDAARFCDWLTNNQPTGAEGNGTTETGSYTLNGAMSDAALNAITRNANANFVIPTENEWYKAAYYNPSTSKYYLYTTMSNSQPSNVLSATGTNNANFYKFGYTDPTNYLTAVGAFAASPSPYGTFDQGGDVYQWDESVYGSSTRGARGGAFVGGANGLESDSGTSLNPSGEGGSFGFRVSQIPEPSSMATTALGALILLKRSGIRR